MSSGWNQARESWLEGQRKVKGAWTGFREFIMRDSVLEIAVGLIIAAAFTRIVNSMVSDILLPFIALLPFMGRNLPQKFLVLKRGPNGGHGYNTIQQAESDGAVTMAYGRFLDSIISFFAIGFVLYILARIYGAVTSESIIKHSYKCKYCRKEIPETAARCAFCCSWMDGREDRGTSALAPS